MQAHRLTTILGLDIGSVRTGVAVANSVARIARPLCVIDMGNESFAERIDALLCEHQPVALVAGLPRDLQGRDTQQTAYVRAVVEEIRDFVRVPIYYIDEAVTSVRAERELEGRKKPYRKADIDMLAATYILEDFIALHPEVFVAHEASL